MSLRYLLSVLNVANVRTPSEENSERIEDMLDQSGNANANFSSEGAVVTGQYVGGRQRWAKDITPISATVVCSAPTGVGISFTLEVDGALTDQVLTVDAAATDHEMDLDTDAVPAGKYVRWKCTAAPAADSTADQIHISMNFNTAF